MPRFSVVICSARARAARQLRIGTGVLLLMVFACASSLALSVYVGWKVGEVTAQL